MRNKPAAPNAGIAQRLIIEHHWKNYEGWSKSQARLHLPWLISFSLDDQRSLITSKPMLKKNRSAPNTAVIPVLYYPDVPEAIEWLTTVLPFTERLRNSDNRRQLVHGNGAIIVTEPGAHADAAPSTLQSPGAHSVTLRVTGIYVFFGRAKASGAHVR